MKLEKIENKNKNCIKESFIHCEKGNFKFITFNYEYNFSFYIEEIEQILEWINKESKISLFVINLFSIGYDDEEMNLFINIMEKIKIVKDMDKSCVFIVEPNDIILELKSKYYMNK